MGAMKLGVNIDHIATLRQARRGRFPDPVEAALVCENSGAESIVCHLREDRRHIQDSDFRRLKKSIRTRLNLEMSIAEDIVLVALQVRPEQVTLVPERRQELTTEGGLDVAKLMGRLKPLILRFHKKGIKVSLFVDPIFSQLHAAKQTGADLVELHTGRYANAKTDAAQLRQLHTLRLAAKQACDLGLPVAAGHGLDYRNTAALADIAEIEELNIGYSIIVRAITVGLESAVKEMVTLLSRVPHELEICR
ncbi:MAG: pyridoxine 5'-phosphate synthase [Candidatus Omnitrophica bacterium]|nr:pyridoxine 5'-phosphate synthase [Candidatus Omnitrophota bacterium]